MHNQRIIDILELSLLENDYEYTSYFWQEQNKKKIWSADSLPEFRKINGLSHGLDDAFIFSQMLERNFDKNDLEGFFLKYFQEEIALSYMLDDNVGNCPFCFKYRGKSFDPSKIPMMYWYYVLEKSLRLKTNNINSFCEIGGGFGAFSEIILRKNKNATLLAIDLPKSNALMTYYLKEIFPDKKFYLYDDYIKTGYLSFEAFANNDIIILPTNIKLDKDIEFDLFINARSMMEMDLGVIYRYFRFINKYISDSGYFLNINRYFKNHSGVPIKFCDYPYDNNWTVINSSSCEYQGHVRLLLTQRCFNIQLQNIQQELNNIKAITKDFEIEYTEGTLKHHSL